MAIRSIVGRRKRSLQRPAVLGCLVLTASACAGSRGTVESDRSVITGEELASTTAVNLYEAIDRLRPLWLLSGGPRSVVLETEIAVIVDGSYFGSVQTLRGFPLQGVQEIRHIRDAAEAAAAMPRLTTSRVIEAAILIRMARERE